MSQTKDIYTCSFCPIGHHKSVECAGIYYCPNPLCTGPGGAWFRAKLTSYKSDPDGRHTVNWTEWVAEAEAYLEDPKNEKDAQIRKAFDDSVLAIKEREDVELRKQTGKKLDLMQDTEHV